jgi:hypothetical protein
MLETFRVILVHFQAASQSHQGVAKIMELDPIGVFNSLELTRFVRSADGALTDLFRISAARLIHLPRRRAVRSAANSKRGNRQARQRVFNQITKPTSFSGAIQLGDILETCPCK